MWAAKDGAPTFCVRDEYEGLKFCLRAGEGACGPNIAQAGVPVPHDGEKVAVHVQDRGRFSPGLIIRS